MLVTGPGRDPMQLDGAAAVTWMALGSSASAPEVLERVHTAWPELAEVELDGVAEALRILAEADLVVEGRR